MAKKVENRSLTMTKDRLKVIAKLQTELDETFSGIMTMTYDFYIKYNGKVNNTEPLDKGGRGFEYVSVSNRKGVFAKLPQQGTVGSAGYDFYLPENVLLQPGESSKVIFTNVKSYMNKDEVLKLYIRSSIGIKHGIVLKNGTGIIDATYYNNKENEGNIGIVLINTSNKSVLLEEGTRIMQGVFQKYLLSDNCNSKKAREGGFGSTDK